MKNTKERKKIIKYLPILLILIILVIMMYVINNVMNVNIINWFTKKEEIKKETQSISWDISKYGSGNVTATYNPDTKILTITGTGAMHEYNYTVNAPWNNYYNEIEQIIIGKDISEIDEGSFVSLYALIKIEVDNENSNYSSEDGILFNKNKTTLIKYPSSKLNESYTIPNTIKMIKRFSFYNCKFLINIEILENVFLIEKEAIRNCQKLSAINVNSTNLNFYSAEGVLFDKYDNILKAYPCGKSNGTYTIPNNVKIIEHTAFSRCSKLTRNRNTIWFNDYRRASF